VSSVYSEITELFLHQAVKYLYYMAGENLECKKLKRIKPGTNVMIFKNVFPEQFG
jgi:hypothetical protein